MALTYDIVLVRHGESETNLDPTKHIGQDRFAHLVALTELGVQQSAACGEQIETRFPRAQLSVFVSPYARAQQTWDELQKSFRSVTAVEVITDGRIREQEFKDFKSLEELEEKKIRAKQRGKLYYRYKNAESGFDVLSRVGGFYNQLRLDLHFGNRSPTVLIVAHEIVIRCFLMVALDIGPEHGQKLYIDNGAMAWLRACENLKFTVVEAEKRLLKALKKSLPE